MTRLARLTVVVFGGQQISVDTVRDLLDGGLEVAAIVTKRRPHDDVYGYASMCRVASDHDIPLLEPQCVDRECVEKIRRLAPDLIISTYYRNILPREVLDIPRLGSVNVHPGRLPHYRGPIPTFWALVNGESSCGVTLHFMDAGVDTGPIIAQDEVAITAGDTGFTLSTRVMQAGHALLMRNLNAIMAGDVEARDQDPTQGSYFGGFSDRLRYIDWRKGSRAIHNQVRALTHPYAGSLAFSGDRQIVIWRVQIPEKTYAVSVPPGKIRTVNADGSFVVATSDGCVTVTEYEVVSNGPDQPLREVIRAGRLLC